MSDMSVEDHCEEMGATSLMEILNDGNYLSVLVYVWLGNTDVTIGVDYIDVNTPDDTGMEPSGNMEAAWALVQESMMSSIVAIYSFVLLCYTTRQWTQQWVWSDDQWSFACDQ